MTTEPDDGGGAVPHLVFRAARRRWPLVLAGAVVGAVLGAGLATVLPHRFVAEAQVLVRPVSSDANAARPTTTTTVTMETEAQIARSGVVEALTAEKVAAGPNLPADLGPGLAVTVLPDTQVLRFTYTADTPKVAKEVAQAYATSYLANRETAARQFVDQERRRLGEQIATLRAQEAELETELAGEDEGSNEHRRLSLEISRIGGLLVTAEKDLSNLRTSSVVPGQIIRDASSAERTGATPEMVAVGGLLLGLALGLGIATLRERTDPRLLDPGDLSDDLGVPLLAVLPPHEPGGGVVDPDGAGADAYRQLRNEIFLGPQPPVVLAVSRVDAETGTGDVTANLAVLLARSGRRVCVIDTDTSPVRLDTLLEGHDRVGLVHATPDGDSRFEAGIAVVTQREGLGQAELGDLLASPLFARLIDATRHEAEVVLIDAPPALTSAGQAVLSTADAVLLVVTRRRSHRGDVLSAQDRIRRAGSRLVGTALRESVTRGRRPTGPPLRRDAETGPPTLPPAERLGLPAAPSHAQAGAASTTHDLRRDDHRVGPAASVETPVFAPTPPGRGPWVTDTGRDPLGAPAGSGPLQPPAAEPAASVAPDTYPGPVDPSRPPAPAAEPAEAAGDAQHRIPLDVPLGWPARDADGTDGRVAGAPTDLGWPETRRALT